MEVKQGGLVLADISGYTRFTRMHFTSLLHFGRAAFKSIGQFDELAGEDVILIHRLLKNSVPAAEYALMTERFYRLSAGVGAVAPQARIETAEGLGRVPVWVVPLGRPEDTTPAADD